MSGDGLLDEVIDAGAPSFGHFAAEFSWVSVTYSQWLLFWVQVPGYFYSSGFYADGDGARYYVPPDMIPYWAEFDAVATIPLVRPVFQFTAEPGYDYEIRRLNNNGTLAPEPVFSIDGLLVHAGMNEILPSGPWSFPEYYTIPYALVRYSLAPGGCVLNLPGMGGVVTAGAGGSVSGSLKLPGGITVTASTGSSTATIVFPSGASVTIDAAGNVTGVLPSGVIHVAGQGSITLPSGIAVIPSLGGITIAAPSGVAVHVDTSGGMRLELPSGVTGAAIGNVIDELGKQLGLGNVRVRVDGGIWGSVSSINLGGLSTGDHNVDITTDTRGVPAVANTRTIVVRILPALSNLEWIAVDSPLTDNPSAGGGLRIYAGKTTPTDTVNRERVKLRATISPALAGVNVAFRVFDVDDPSTDSAPLDDESQATDNHGTWAQPTGSATTNNSGVAEVEFQVSKQPGDNFRAVATLANGAVFGGLSARQNDGSNERIRDASNNNVTSSVGLRVSVPLTVWRHIHIEVDSMGAVSGNQITGNITNISGHILTTNQSLPATESPNRFSGGRFYQNNDSWNVSSSTIGPNFTITANWLTTAAQLGGFVLKDDDMMSTGTNSHLTAPVPIPDTSHVVAAFRPAYVDAIFDGGGNLVNNETGITFPINTELNNPVSTLLTHRQSPQISDDYWSIYVVGAFQGPADSDNDPDGEHSGAITAGGNLTNATNTRWLAMFFYETNRDKGSLSLQNWIVAHEIGHYFVPDPHEKDGSLMSDGPLVTSPYFSNNSLRLIRKRRF